MNISATSCNITTEDLENFENHFVLSYKKAFDSLEPNQELNLKSFIQDYYKQVTDIVDEPSQKYEKALLATLVGAVALVNTARNKKNAKYFPEYIVEQLGNIPWNIATDSSKGKVLEYLNLKPTVDPVITPISITTVDDRDYEESLFEINTMNIALLFQPTDSEFYDNSDLSKNVIQSNGVKAFRKFIDYFLSNTLKTISDKDPVLNNLYIRLYNIKDVDSSKIYGNPKGNKYIFLITDAKGEPVFINDDGVIDSSGSYYIASYSRIPDEVINNIDKYMDGSTDSVLLDLLLKRGMVLNPNKYKVNTLNTLKENLETERNADRIIELENSIEIIENEKKDYVNNLLSTTRNIARFIKDKILVNPESNLIKIDDINSRIGYLRYISKLSQLEEKGDTYITNDLRELLSGITSVSYNPAKVSGVKQNARLVINDKFDITIFLGNNKLGSPTERKNERLLPIVDALVELMSNDEILYQGVPLTTEEKQRIFESFYFKEITFKTASAKHNLKSYESNWYVQIYNPTDRTYTEYRKLNNKEGFKQALRQSLEQNYLLNPNEQEIEIPSIVQDGDNKILTLTKINSADYIAQYYKLPVTVSEGSDTLPILNPILAINFTEPFSTQKDEFVAEEDLGDVLWMSKNIANLSTDKLNQKALEWFNSNPVTKNVPLQKLFDIVNSGAFATWSKAGVTLYNGSQYTDLYHEAWHEFTEMWFTPEQKQQLFEEVKKIKGRVTYYYKNKQITKPASEIDTYEEAMEFLADQYRLFAIDESNSVVTKAIKAIFKAIKKLLDSLFSKTTALDNNINAFDNPAIREIFNTLYTGDIKKLEAYRYDINQGSTNILQKTIVGVGDKKTRYKFTSEETLLLQKTIDSIIFSAGITPMLMQAGAQDKILGSVRLLFKVDNIESVYQLISRGLQSRYNLFKSLVEQTTNEDLKKSYESTVKLFGIALQNLGDVTKLKSRTENQGIIKYYIEENEFINEIYQDEDEDFLSKDDGQYSDKGNNSTSVHNDFSPYLKFMFTKMPKIKVLKDNTLYINDALTEGIKKVGDLFYKVNMLSGAESILTKGEFYELFSKNKYSVAGNGDIVLGSHYVERDSAGLPLTLDNANIAITKLISTPGLVGRLDPLSIPEIIKAYAQNGSSITDKLFYASVYGIIGGNTLEKWQQLNIQNAENVIEEKAKAYPAFYEHVKEHFFTFNSLLKSLSREKVLPIIANVSYDSKKKQYILESYIGNTEFISFWNKREIEYTDFVSKLSVEEQNRYGLEQVGSELKFNAAKFFAHPENKKLYDPTSSQYKSTVVFTYQDNIYKIVNYLKLLGILNSSIEYPDTLIKDMLKDSTIIDGLNALNMVLFNNRNKLSSVDNIVNLLKKGDPTIKDLKQLTLVEKIFAAANQIEITTNDNMYTNPSGDIENEFSLQSSMMRYVQLYNDENLKESINQSPNENPFWADSLLNKLVYQQGKKFRLFKASGIANDTNTGITENDNNVFTANIEAMINLRIHNAYRMYQHAGKSTQHYMSIDKVPFISYATADVQAENVFYNQLYNYFIAEAIRVYQTKQGEHDNVEMFSKFGKKYLFFDYIDSETTNLVESLIKEVYDSKRNDNVENVITSVKQKLQGTQADAIKAAIKVEHDSRITAGINSFAKIDPTVLTNIDASINKTLGIEVEADGQRLYKHSYMNMTLFNIESNIFIYGDLANYNLDKDEFSKRNALWGSGGNPVYSDPDYLNLIKSIFDFSDSSSEIINMQELPVAILEDVKVTSENYNEYEEAIKSIIEDVKVAEKRTKPYSDMKEADAQGVVLLPTYRMLSLSSGNWDNTKELYYNKIMRGETLPLNISEFFPSLKYQFAGPAKYKKDNVYKNIQAFTLKFNIVPLIPPVLNPKIGEEQKQRYLNLIYNKMLNEKIGLLTYVSGSKNSFFFDKTSNLFYDNEGNLTDKPFVKNFINTTFFKDQLYIAPVFKGKSLVSSQKRTKILDLFFENGKLKSEFKKYGPLVEEYKQSIADATQMFKDKLSATLQIDLKNPDKKGMEKFAGYIKELLKKKGYITEDETDMIAVIDGAFAYDYLGSGLAVILDNIIANIIEKNIIQQKFPGEPLIQVANTGWEFVETDPLLKRVLKDKVRYSNKLKSYRKAKDGTILPAQVKISMQGDFYKLLNLTHTDGNSIGTIPRLNEMMAKPEWKKLHMDKFIITGDRIPVHAHPSMEVLEIEEFLDPIASNIIVLPSEIVAKSGGDFDVDKLTLLYPSFDEEGNILKYSLSYNESKAKIKKLNSKLKVEEERSAAYYKLLRKILSAVTTDLKRTGMQNVAELASANKAKQYRKVVNNNQEALAEYDELTLEGDETLESIEKKIEDINQKIADIFTNKSELETKEDTLTEAEKQMLKVAEEYQKEVYYYKNIAGALGNRINKNVASLLLIEELLPYLILPTTDENLKEISKRNDNITLSEFPIATNYSYITDPFQSLLKLDYNSAGKKSLGIIAVFSSMLNEMAESNLQMPNAIIGKNGSVTVVKIPFNYKTTKHEIDVIVDSDNVTVEIDALDYSALTNLNGKDKGDYTGQKIQASVDVEKDPWLLRLGIRKNTASFQLGLTGAGVNEEPVSIFLLNPMVNLYVRYTEIAKTPLLPFFGRILNNTKSPSTVDKFKSIIQPNEFRKLVEQSNYSSEIKNKVNTILGQKFTKTSIVKLNNVFAEESKLVYESLDFNAAHYIGNSDYNTNVLNQAIGLIHYLALNQMFDSTINKLSFALRPDRQRFASILDFILFDRKFQELYSTMPEFTKESLLSIKRNSVRSSFYINTGSLPKTLLESLSPSMIQVVDFIYRNHYQDKIYESQMPFKDTKTAIKLYSNIIRSVMLQKLLNSRYKNDVYKGFNVIASTEFDADNNAVQTSVLKNDFNILLTSAVKVIEVTDEANNVVEKSLYVNRLNIALFAAGTSSDLDSSDYYVAYNIVKPDYRILKGTKRLEKYLIEYEIAKNKYPFNDFKNSTYYKQVYKNIEEDATYKDIKSKKPNLSKSQYAYQLFLRDMATISSMPVSVLSTKSISQTSTNIGYFINQIKVAYANVLLQAYPVLNNLNTKIKDNSDTLQIEIVGIKDNLEYYRKQIQTLIDPTKRTLSNSFDNMVLSDILTGVGLFSVMQNNTSSTSSKVQQLFVNESLLKNLATVAMSKPELEKLLKSIESDVVAANNHKKPGYIYVVPEQESETKNTLDVVPYRNIKTTKSTLFVAKSVSTSTTDTTQTAVSTQPETARTIYDKINKDKKTKSTNVEIAGQGDLSDVKYSAKTFWSEVVPEARAWFGDNLIIAYRGKKTNTFLQNYKGRLSGEPALTIGNPFDWQAETGTRDEQGIKSTKRFIHWMITGDNMGVTEATPEYRQAIIDDIKNGKLKNRPIIYYQEKGYATHATALDYLINEYNWNQPTTPTVSEGIEINSKQTGLGNDLTNVHFATNGKSKFDIIPTDKSLKNPDSVKLDSNDLAVKWAIDKGLKTYADAYGQSVEAWYKSNNAMSKGIPKGTEGDAYDMKLMIGLITDKLKQYPNLVTQITERGGLAFLDKSTHTMGTGRWSSKNPKNMFMNALKQAYQNVSATPTVTAKPTTQTLESKTELEVYIPDYSLAKSVHNTIQGRVAKGENFATVKNELYKKFYDSISEKYDQIPKDVNFNIRYVFGNNIIETKSIQDEARIKNVLVYDSITNRDPEIEKILTGLLYINAFVLYQKFGKINKQFLPPNLVAKVVVRETIDKANINENELNKVLEIIRNC
jgi:hypothetical protein